MGARGARLIRSGQMLGGRGVRVGRNADKCSLPLRKRCGNDVGRACGLHRLYDCGREAAVAVMAAERLVVTIAGRAVVENQRDLRAAGRAGYIDVVRAMQRAREQIHDRHEHSDEPAPVARAAGSEGAAVQDHEFTLAVGSAAVAWRQEQCRPAIMLRVGNSEIGRASCRERVCSTV